SRRAGPEAGYATVDTHAPRFGPVRQGADVGQGRIGAYASRRFAAERVGPLAGEAYARGDGRAVGPPAQVGGRRAVGREADDPRVGDAVVGRPAGLVTLAAFGEERRCAESGKWVASERRTVGDSPDQVASFAEVRRLRHPDEPDAGHA